MADWVASQFHAQILIVMRHPCGFASSLDTLDWPLNVNVILGQKKLVQDHLGPFRDTLRRARHDKWLTRGAIWGAVYTVLTHQLKTHPSWRVLKYEDLCNDPISQYEALAQEFELELRLHTRKRIRVLSASDNADPGSTQRNSRSMPDIWRKRMSSGEIDAVMGVAGEFGLGYYTR